MQRVPALVMLFKSQLLSKISKGETCLKSRNNGLIDVQMMEETKIVFIRMILKRTMWYKS